MSINLVKFMCVVGAAYFTVPSGIVTELMTQLRYI